MAGIFSQLLLATECSDFDSGAQTVALALAASLGVGLGAVLPLASNPEFESVAPELAARAEAEAAAKGDTLVAQASQAGVSLDLQVRRGPEPFVEIVDAARDASADLIVIRRRGKRGLFANLLMGEMVSKVVSHAHCSLLIAPRGAQLWRRGVMLCLDPLSTMPSLLAQAVAVARAFELPLHVVSVAADPTQRALADAAVAAAVHEARHGGARAEGQTRCGRAHEQLMAAARDLGVDLIVIARHGQQSLSRAWIGGVAQKVTGLADCPVLIHVPTHRTSTP